MKHTSKLLTALLLTMAFLVSAWHTCRAGNCHRSKEG